MGLIPGSGRSPGEGNCNPLQCSYLDSPMDKGAWWATVHRVANSWTLLSTHARTYYRYSFLHVFFALTSIPEKSLHMGSCTSSSFFFTSSWYSSAWVYRRLRHAFTWACRSISVLCSCKPHMYTLCTCIVGGISSEYISGSETARSEGKCMCGFVHCCQGPVPGTCTPTRTL